MPTSWQPTSRVEAASSPSTRTRACARTSSASSALRASRRGFSGATSRSSSASSPTTASRPTRSSSTSAVSSMQIDRPERGFSYAADAPLDMRMDASAPRSARDIVNETGERELADIFRRYGEERFSRQIARAIVRRRAEQPFERTGDLVEVVRSAIPAPRRFGDGHPAKRVFQALRIVVNEELDVARAGASGGRPTSAPGGPARGHQLPLPRRQDRQALLRRRGARLHVPARPADLRVRQGAVAAAGHAEGDQALARRDGREPPRLVCPAPRGGEDLMATATARAEPRPRRAPRPQPRPRAAASPGPEEAGRGAPAADRERRLDPRRRRASRRHRRAQRRRPAAEHGGRAAGRGVQPAPHAPS